MLLRDSTTGVKAALKENQYSSMMIAQKPTREKKNCICTVKLLISGNAETFQKALGVMYRTEPLHTITGPDNIRL